MKRYAKIPNLKPLPIPRYYNYGMFGMLSISINYRCSSTIDIFESVLIAVTVKKRISLYFGANVVLSVFLRAQIVLSMLSLVQKIVL